MILQKLENEIQYKYIELLFDKMFSLVHFFMQLFRKGVFSIFPAEYFI